MLSVYPESESESVRDTRSRLLAAYRDLPGPEQELVELASVIYSAIPAAGLRMCAEGLQLEIARGDQKTFDQVVVKLVGIGLLTLEDGSCGIRDIFAELATRAALQGGRFERYTPVSPLLDELAEKVRKLDYSRAYQYRDKSYERALRVALYRDDYAAVLDTHRSRYGTMYCDSEDSFRFRTLLEIVDNPYDAEWVQGLSPALQAEVLRPFLARAMAQLIPEPERFALLEEACSDPQIRSWQGYPSFFAECLIARGRLDEATRVLSEAEDWRSLCIQAWLDVQMGQYDRALKRYSKALRERRREPYRTHMHFDSLYAGLFHIPVLLRSGDESSVNSALRHTKSVYSGHYHEVHKALGNVAESLIDVSRVSQPPRALYADTRDVQVELVHALALYWLVPDRLHQQVDAIAKLTERARAGEYHWLEFELNALLEAVARSAARSVARSGDRPGDESTANASAARKGGASPRVAMVDIMAPVPIWQRSLEALVETARGGEARVASNRQKRLVWLFSNSNGEWAIRPVVQSLGVRGKWLKGKSLALGKLHERTASLDYLTEQDREVCAAIRSRERGRRRYANTISFQMDPRAALRALIGHPLLFWNSWPYEPLTLGKGEPEMHITRSESGLTLSLSPAIERGQSYVLRQDSASHLTFFELTPEKERMVEIIGSGLQIPERGKAQLMDAIAAVSGLVTINADIDHDPDAGEAEPGDTRPRMQLVPRGNGLKLRVLVRPFGNFGPYFQPGIGGQMAFAKHEDKARATRRDLAEEKQRSEAALDACPTVAAAETRPGEWIMSEPDQCLAALVELRALEDDIVLEWPEGQSLRVREASSGDLRLSVRRTGDWFEASGTIDVGDGAILEMRQLLALLDNHSGRFLPLGEGKFLALTSALRKSLDELKAVAAEKDSRRPGDAQAPLRISPLAAPVIEDLAQGAGAVQGDKAWKKHLARIAEANALQIEIPSTLRAELREYQREGFFWLCRLAHWGAGACLADDMGLGKTVQALAFLLTQAKRGPILIIAPTSVCANWMVEIDRFAPTLKTIYLAAGDRREIIANLAPFDVVIASYGLLQSEADLLAESHWRAVVLDEAQAIKNQATKRSKAAMRLDADCKLVTTGTPIENHLGELWTLFRFINPGLLGSFKEFARRFATPIEKHGSTSARSALRKLIRPFVLRRLKSQVLHELPPRTESVLHVEMSEKEKALYEALRQRALDKLAGRAQRAGKRPGHVEILAEIMRLRRACCHPRLAVPESTLSGSKLAVLGALLSELEGGRHRALVFSQFVDHLSIIRAYLDQAGVSYQYLDGSTPAAERKKRVDAFQSGVGDVFLISLRAGGTGLNLTAADYVIHMDPWWNPAVEDQASDRAYRIGQSRPVTIYRLITRGTIEEKIVALHSHKRDLAAGLLANTDLTGKMSAEELMALIRES